MAINFLSSINLNKNQLIKAAIENQPGDIAAGAGVEGQVYFDTSTSVKVLKVWNGTGWVEVGGGVLTVTSGNTDTITIGGTTANPTVAANTAAVSDGSPNLVTGNQVYDFVTGIGYVESVDVNGSTFITVTDGGTSADPTFAVSLAATGSPSASTFLRGDNTWAATPNQYTGWTLAGNTGTPQTIASGDTASIVGGTVISTVASGTDTLTINHSTVSRSDTTSSASPAFGGTFTVVDSVTSSAEGHITALNLKTVTVPASPTITLTGDVTGSGTTSIATTIASGAVEFSMMDPVAVVTAAEGIASNDNDVTLPTSAAVKAYVDASVAGGLIYQGGYDAATNTPNLDSPPTIAGIKRGWTYTVTADGTFFTEQVRVGDVLIAEIDTPTTLADWTTVQNNIDLASLTQVGIGNVNAGTGIDVSYSSGTATVSAQATSYSATISATATITHNLGTRDVIIQLYDTVTYETVYSDNVRTTINTATITFSATPTNPIRVVVQK